MTDIVTVNVSQTIAPTPNELQKKGAMISQGGTTATPGTLTLLTELADLTEILTSPASIATAVLTTAQVATITTTQVHGLTLNDVIPLTISGVTTTTTPGLFNGTFNATIIGTSTFTIPVTGTAQAATASTGTWVPASAAEVEQMATTFFAQGSSQGAYVLELGAGNPAEGVTDLQDWITQNPGTIYSYLVPRNWDSLPSFLDLLDTLDGTTAKTYFFVTTTLGTYGNYTALQKSCFALVEAPSYSVWARNALSGLSFAGSWAENDLTAIAWAATNGGLVSATTTTAHGVQPGNTIVISGVTPAGYNGTFVALPGTTASTLKYALTPDPGAETVLGQLDASVGGVATGTTTTAHGVSPGETFTISASVAATIPGGYNGTFTALPGTTGSTLKYALAEDPGTASIYGSLVASPYASDGVNSDEFSCAAPFYVTLNYKPSTTNKVTPTAFSYLFGVTPFPTQGNGPALSALQAASVNVVGTGAEGGISTAILRNGTTKDGRDFTYWYSVDWVQINIQLAIANAIINGSNNPINPLYYNQDGINRLQQVALQVMSSGLTFGLVLGAVTQSQLDGPDFDAALNAGTFDNQSVVNAVPFVPYTVENPTHYSIGEYDGLSCVYTPARGFTHIVFNVNVTDFVSQ